MPEHFVTNLDGQQEDKNKKPRKQIVDASKSAGYKPGGVVPRGKVVAELMFGFWSYLTDSLHEKSLWVPGLHQAFTAVSDRAKIHDAMTELRDVRNRVAHHESIFDRRPEDIRRTIIFVAKGLSPDLRGHIESTSRLPGLLASKP